MAAVVPPLATITHTDDLEPRWDSCDGRAGTFGWDNLDVARLFTAPLSMTAVLTRARTAMAALGWRPIGSPSNGGTELAWQRFFPGTGTGVTTLTPGPTGGWELDAKAPPRGRRASGC